MSVGIQQQDKNVAGPLYQSAIMQSNPYGIAYKNLSAAKSIAGIADEFVELHSCENPDRPVDPTNKKNPPLDPEDPSKCFETKVLEDLSFADVLKVQAHLKSPAVLGQGLVQYSPATSGFLPFAPYIEKDKEGDIPAEYKASMLEQPSKTKFSVPTVVGFNTDEANLFTAILEPALFTELNLKIAGKEISMDSYPLITKAFFGGALDIAVGGKTGSKLLKVDTYAPADGIQTDPKVAAANAQSARKMANDMLFSCAAREVVKNNAGMATLYHFEYTPDFAVWTMDALPSYVGPLSALSCFGASCHAAELPFMFNKKLNIKSENANTSKTDEALMNTMASKWHNAELFIAPYIEGQDTVLMINENGFEPISDWDFEKNENRCQVLEDKGLIFNHI